MVQLNEKFIGFKEETDIPIQISDIVTVEIVSSEKTKLTLEQKIFHMLNETNENWCGSERLKEIKEKRTIELADIIQDHLIDVGIEAFLLEINYLKFIPNIEEPI